MSMRFLDAIMIGFKAAKKSIYVVSSKARQFV